MVTAEMCFELGKGYTNFTIEGVLLAIIFGAVFYVANWKNKTRIPVIISTIILIIAIVLLFSVTGWFSGCT